MTSTWCHRQGFVRHGLLDGVGLKLMDLVTVLLTTETFVAVPSYSHCLVETSTTTSGIPELGIELLLAGFDVAVSRFLVPLCHRDE